MAIRRHTGPRIWRREPSDVKRPSSQAQHDAQDRVREILWSRNDDVDVVSCYSNGVLMAMRLVRRGPHDGRQVSAKTTRLQADGRGILWKGRGGMRRVARLKSHNSLISLCSHRHVYRRRADRKPARHLVRNGPKYQLKHKLEPWGYFLLRVNQMLRPFYFCERNVDMPLLRSPLSTTARHPRSDPGLELHPAAFSRFGVVLLHSGRCLFGSSGFPSSNRK